jgi:hypothetical protein
MYIYIYVDIYIYIHVRIYICVYIHIHTNLYICTYSVVVSEMAFPPQLTVPLTHHFPDLPLRQKLGTEIASYVLSLRYS